ncbi:MAG TPA: hypothetical protein VNJ28_07440, partial [Candidatus Limnocylindrales bacterium]|nr:hypothetical protein [Candidatus Limnocylindrales bacterium]
AGPGGGRSVPFDGLTEEWRLVGRMHIEGRLSDALNRRQSISLSDVRWAPADGSRPLEPAPGVRSVDPYDLIVVLTGQGSLPPDSRDERGAHRVRKVPYDVLLDAPPFQVVGTVHLYPGTEPDRLLDRATEMFVALTDAVALYGGREIEAPGSDVVLVNRFYLRGVEQVDKRTREKVRPLPGQPLGGTSWRERS